MCDAAAVETLSFLRIQAAIVRVVGFVVHHQRVVDKVKWVGSCFEWIGNHFVYYKCVVMENVSGKGERKKLEKNTTDQGENRFYAIQAV